MELITLVYVLLILAFAKAFGEIVSRFNQPAIVGELLAGIVLGPFLLGELIPALGDMYMSSDGESSSALFINDLAEFGMLFLMLYAGLEFSPRVIRESSWVGGAIAAVGLAIPMAGGLFVGLAFGYGGLRLAFIAVAVGVTALPVTIRVLEDLGVIRIRTSSVVVSAALITDVVVMLGLGLILSANKGDLSYLNLAVMTLGFVSFFVLAYLVGRFVVPHIYELLKRMRTGEAAFAVAIGFAIGFAILAVRLGLPSVIGAFIAGVLLRETCSGLRVWERVQDILAGVTIGFFAPIFFVEIGFAVAFDAVASAIPLFVSIVAVAVAGKLVGSYLPARVWGCGKNESKAIASMMMGKGAMELVFASLAFQVGLIGEDIFSILVLMAFVSTMMAPILFRHYFNKAVDAEEIPPPKGRKGRMGLINVSESP
ncbi:MAG TPA: cation:proton antiporter [Thermoplasmata archaeon]